MNRKKFIYLSLLALPQASICCASIEIRHLPIFC